MREFTTKDLGWIAARLGAIVHRNETARRTIELMQAADSDVARLQVIYDLIHEIYEYKDTVERRIEFFNDIERRHKKVKISKKRGVKHGFRRNKSKAFGVA